MIENNNANNSVVKPKKNDDKVDLKTFLSKLKTDWWVFIVSFMFCGLCAALFVYYKAPAYNITAQVLIDDETGNASSSMSSSGSMLDLSSLLDLKSNVDNEAQVLSTRHLLQQTVEDMKLNVIYYQRRYLTDLQINRNPIIATIIKPVDTIVTTKFKVSKVDSNSFSIKYKETNPDNSTTSKKSVYKYGQPFIVGGVGVIKVDKNPLYSFGDNDYRFDIENEDQRIYELQQIFTITITNSTTSTIDMVFDYPIPYEGEQIMQKLIDNYKFQNVQLKNQVADSTIKFINNRLVDVSAELSSVEQTIQDFKQKNKLADISEQGKLLVGNSNSYIDQLNKNETQLSIMTSLLEYLEDENKNKTVVPVSVLPDDPVFAALVDSYNQLLIERDRQSLSVTPDNPFMQNLENRIVVLRKNMIKNLTTTQRALQITNKQLQDKSNGFIDQITKVPGKQRTYLDMSRQEDIKQTLYTYLLQKKEETEISKTSNLSIATVIDPPKADYKPYSPNILIVAGVAFIMALAFPIGRVIAKDLFNNKILTREDITKNTSVPIIGEISHNLSGNNIVVLDGDRSAIAEQFRSLRTNLQFFINKANEKVILITSSMSGEGKSFTTINLAGILAVSGKKVLLMELDLRKPKLSVYFGIDNSNGFSNYIISDKVPLSSIISHSAFHENLYIISSGPLPPNPAELILDERTDDMIAQLRKEFDYIIIDAPPVGLVTDAQLMNRFSDTTLYIVRQNYTLKDQLQVVEDLYVNNKMKKISLVVNDIEIKRGYGYGYSYGYGYGYGYYENEEKRGVIQRIKKLFTRNKV